MNMTSIGDLAQTFLLHRRNADLKQDLQRLSLELASGQTGDIAEHLGGTYNRLSSIEQDMRLLGGYKTAQGELAQMTSTMQISLERIRTESGELAEDLLLSSQSTLNEMRDPALLNARETLESTVAMLNAQSAGRTLFSGDATDQPALAPAEDILAAVSAAVASATDAAGLIAAVDTWFSDPAGFDTVAYLGSTTGLAPVQISPTATVDIETRADTDEIKTVLRSITLAAIVGEPGFPLSEAETTAVLRDAGENLFAAQSDMIGLQAKLGSTEEQIANWTARTNADLVGLEYAKGALLEVDPFETATRLEQAQIQLEGLYSVTVRLSQLSLVNFLR